MILRAPYPSFPAPTGVTATAVGAAQIDLSWNAVTGATSYTVYRSTDGNNFSLHATIATTTYSDTGLSANTQYWYFLRATDGTKDSGASSTVTATTAAFSPNSIATLLAWFDATDGSTLFTDTGGTTPVSTNGDTVRRWNDKSGGNRHLSGSTGPAYRTSGIAGLPAVEFTGAQLLPFAAALSAGNDCTLVMVHYPNVNSSVGLFDSAPGGGSTIRFIADNIEIHSNNPVGALTTIRHPLVTTFLIDIPTNRRVRYYRFGDLLSTFSGSSNAAINWTTPRFGNAVNAGSYNGKIAEICLYDGVLSTSDQQALENYLMDKYNLTLPLLALHLDASDSSTLFQDTAGTTPVVNSGDPIALWKDKSGYSRDYSQATSTLCPAYTTGIVNGLPIVRFASDYIQAGALGALGSHLTLFMVVRPSTTTPVGLIDTGPGAGNVFRNYGAGSMEWHSASPSFALGLPNTNPVLLAFDVSLVNQRKIIYYRNGTLISTNTNASTAPMTWSNPVLGAINTGNAGYYNGDICEVRAYLNNLTTSQRQAIESELMTKWGIP